MYRLHAASIAALLVASSSLAAQQQSDTAHVAPVVVTATRTPLRADRAPATVSIIDGADLRARGVVHLADALRGVPGVTVASAGSWGAPTSLFVRGGQANYTKVLIDGVPANEPGGAFDFGTLTLDDVERIEIVRGPSSVVWGSDAVSGVVHIVTRRGARDAAALAARAGTHGTVDLVGSAERAGGPWMAALTGARHETDGIYDFNSAYRNTLLGGSVGRIGSRSTVRLGGRYARTRAHFPTDFTGTPVDPNAYRTEERSHVSADLSRAVAGATVRLIGGHTLINGSSIDPWNVPGLPSTAYDTRTSRQQLELRADVPLATGLALSLGGVGEWQRRASATTTMVEDGSTMPGSVDRTEGDAHRELRGAFVELLAGHRGSTATVGGRYDHSSTYGDFATWRVGVSQQLPGALRLRASVGTAFREPSFDEMLPGPFSTGNPDIRPESSTSWEIGAEQRFVGERVVVGATWFTQRFTDMIDYFSESFPGRYENVASARASGLELEAALAAHPRVRVDAGATFLRTRVESAGYGSTLADGRTLLRRPGRSATAGIAYSDGAAAAALRVGFTGERQDVRFLYDAPFSREETLPAYTRVDLSGRLPLLARRTGALGATLRVENLLGARYESTAGYRAPGRTVLAGVEANF